MSDLIDTTEMYLRTIFELEEEGVPPLRARIAERLQQTGPTVSQTVARMERDGLLVLAPDRSLQLTDEGRTIAVRVMRKHRLAECMLVDIIGLPLDAVHEEACRWEHVMSEEVEQRLIALLDNPDVSPFGNPIPGLEEFGAGASPAAPWAALSDTLTEAPPEVTVLRIGEQVQHQQELIAELAQAGLRPGARMTVRRLADDALEIDIAGSQVRLPEWAAAQIMVERVIDVDEQSL